MEVGEELLEAFHTGRATEEVGKHFQKQLQVETPHLQPKLRRSSLMFKRFLVKWIKSTFSLISCGEKLYNRKFDRFTIGVDLKGFIYSSNLSTFYNRCTVIIACLSKWRRISVLEMMSGEELACFETAGDDYDDIEVKV